MNVPRNVSRPEDKLRSALEGLLEIATRLAEGMQADALARHLTVARAEIVWLLAQQGPMRQLDIATSLKVSPRNVTGLLDGLQRTGFVIRRAHPHDRRAVLVQLTAKGRAVSAELLREQPRFARWLFTRLDEAELDLLLMLEA